MKFLLLTLVSVVSAVLAASQQQLDRQLKAARRHAKEWLAKHKALAAESKALYDRLGKEKQLLTDDASYARYNKGTEKLRALNKRSDAAFAKYKEYHAQEGKLVNAWNKAEGERVDAANAKIDAHNAAARRHNARENARVARHNAGVRRHNAGVRRHNAGVRRHNSRRSSYRRWR